MQVDKWINKIFAGCGRETEKLELQSILTQIAEEYHRGEMKDEELEELADKLCNSIVVYASQCGKPMTVDQCKQELIANVKASIPRGVLLEMVTTRRRLKRKTKSSTSVGGIL